MDRSRVGEELGRLADVVRRRFTVDTRALAALRIGLGLILLVDLVHRWPFIQHFYTDAGVYPLATFEVTYTSLNGVSLHALSGQLWFQHLLFVVAALAAAVLVLGYRSRLAALVSLVLLFSLHARTPVVLNGGDILLRVMLFLAILTPLGERWSIDAIRRGSARETVASWGTTALLVQPIVVFTANAVKKHRGETWFAGEALELALNNDVMTYHLGNALGDHADLLTALNYGWLVLVAGSLVFLLATVGRVRALAALTYIGAFAGMLVTLSVGLFPLVLAVAVVPYLTTPFWDAVARHAAGGRRTAGLDREALGPLGREPAEGRWLARLRGTGREDLARFLVASGRAVVAVGGVLALAWMIGFTAHDLTDGGPPEGLDHLVVDHQRWGLYAPNPSTAYSWPVVEATLADGSNVSAIDDRPLDFGRPEDASERFETFRHRKAWGSVQRSAEGEPGPIAVSYADWACRRAGQIHGQPAEAVKIHRMYQRIAVDGEPEDLRKIRLMRYECPA